MAVRISSDLTLHVFIMLCVSELCCTNLCSLFECVIHEWIKKKSAQTRMLKNKIFKQKIGIAEKSQEQEGIAVMVMP